MYNTDIDLAVVKVGRTTFVSSADLADVMLEYKRGFDELPLTREAKQSLKDFAQTLHNIFDSMNQPLKNGLLTVDGKIMIDC